jgi:hypothetical protein
VEVSRSAKHPRLLLKSVNECKKSFIAFANSERKMNELPHMVKFRQRGKERKEGKIVMKS